MDNTRTESLEDDLRNERQNETNEQTIVDIKNRIEILINKLIEINLILNERGNYLKNSFLSNSSLDESHSEEDKYVLFNESFDKKEELNKLENIQKKYKNVILFNKR